MSVQGRDLLTGKPKQVEVSYREIAKVIRHQFKELKMLLWKLQTPPELAALLQYRYLSCWWFYVERIGQRKTDLPVYIAEDP
jgi:rod shape-determining protein MreB